MLETMPDTAAHDRDQEAPGSSAGQPARQFGWWDMFVGPDDDPREDDEGFEGERGLLARYLRDRRLTLEMKCDGRVGQ